MYEQFYGLKENPFNVTPNPEYIYLGENHREALSQLLYGVREKKGFVVITGEVGTGKTTLIHYLLDKFEGNNHTKTAFLFNPKLAVEDFIQYILRDLGEEIEGKTKGDHLHQLHRYLLEAYRNEERIVLIVDEAQGLNPELLEEIRLLSNLETSKVEVDSNRIDRSTGVGSDAFTDGISSDSGSGSICDITCRLFLKKRQRSISKRG